MAGSGVYGPVWRIDGPPPLPPRYGIMQAADAAAPEVGLVTDVAMDAAAQAAAARRAQWEELVSSGASTSEILAALHGVVSSRALADEMRAGAGVERWINGVILYPYPSQVASVWNACAPASEFVPKGTGAELTQPEFAAMTVYLAETCTSSKVWNQEAFQARATLALGATYSASVAREFMGGAVLPLNPHLADGNGTFPNGNAATTSTEALALLEGEIAKSGKRGVIHVSPMMATVLMSRFLAIDVDGVIRTRLGTVILPDAGYVYGSTPFGHAAPGARQEWMYATGPIEVRRSAVFTVPGDVSQALDRGTGGAGDAGPNSITYRAEQFIVVDWDQQLQSAVLADRCSDVC